MNLGKGIVWASIVFISAAISTTLHIAEILRFPWGMMTAAIATLIAMRVDLSQSRFLPLLVRMEKYRLPVLIVFMPLSLILIPVNFWAGISAVLITATIMFSYTVGIMP